jgi:hypothetical protein
MISETQLSLILIFLSGATQASRLFVRFAAHFAARFDMVLHMFFPRQILR